MTVHSATLEGVRSRSAGWSALLGLLAPAGRVLYSTVFIAAAFTYFEPATIAYAAAQGVRSPDLVVPLAGLLAAVGGLSVALGYRAKLGAWLLVVFLVPVSLRMHNFWAVSDPMLAAMQQAMFVKNLSLLGGALFVAYFGAGPFSLDARHAGETTP
jgi:putative oxidoreductase